MARPHIYLNETKEERRARLTETTRRYRDRHPDRVKRSRKMVYLTRKRRALEIIGGAKCVECGCDELEYLEINHIGGGGCKEIKKLGCTLTDKILSGKRSPNGLNVLCRACNAIEFLYRKKPSKRGKFNIKWKLTGENPQNGSEAS